MNKKLRQTQITQWNLKKTTLEGHEDFIIKNTRQDEQQNQITTSNINSI